MGSYVCKKCEINQNSPYIIDNCYRTHCRIHNFVKDDEETFFCKDCRSDNKNKNCRHVFKFKFLCCK